MLRFLGSHMGGLVGLMARLWPFRTSLEPVILGVDHVPQPESSPEEVEAVIVELLARKDAWCSLTCKERANLLRQCLKTCIASSRAIAEETARYKGCYGNGVGEEMSMIVPIIVALEEFIAAMDAEGAPKLVGLKQHKNGQWIADVWPRGLDNLLWGGAHSEVWIKPGAQPTQGKLYKDKAAGTAEVPEGICVLLAAGNVMAVTAIDMFHQLLRKDCVVLVKMNPVNDYAGKQLEMCLKPLHDGGFFRCVYGGPQVAQMAVHDERVDRVHLTGSLATYNAIMLNGGTTPLLDKPFEAELGCVTPYIIVPSHREWSKMEMEYVAQSVLASKVLNSSHNCNAVEVIVTAKDWPQRQHFMSTVQAALDALPQRAPWYPNSAAKAEAFHAKFPGAVQLGSGLCTKEKCTTAWLMARDLTPDTAQLDQENWCGCLQEVSLDTVTKEGGKLDIAAFMKDAVDFCNDKCAGTLCMGLAIHPSTQSQNSKDFDSAMEKLRYGTIVVNGGLSMGYANISTPWGAFGAAGTLDDMGSGNALSMCTPMFDHPEKGIVHFPWMLPIKPVWSPSHTNLGATAEAFARYAANKNIITLHKLIFSALATK